MNREEIDIDALMDKFPRDASTQELYETASRLASRDCTQEAEKLFKFLINNRDKIAPYFTGASFFKLGEMAQCRKNTTAAEDYYRQCLQYTPHHFRASTYLGLHREYTREWEHLCHRLMTVVKRVNHMPAPGTGKIDGSSRVRQFWQNISTEKSVKKVHEFFMRFFSYPLSPAPGEEAEQYIRQLEEKYELQKNLYWKRLQFLPTPSLKQWIADTARELDRIIKNNVIVEDVYRQQREFLFWALCVQVELIGEVLLARKMADHYFRRFLESFILARQIRHLSLLKLPAAGINGKDPVSIVTPFYNGEQYVEETLESIAGQTYRNFEWIVVNDGSGARSTGALQEIAARYPEVNTRIINSDHVGQAAATNIGIRAARGKYILPLDADDQVAVDYLEKTINEFEKNRTLDVVYSQTVAFGFRNRLMVLADFDIPGIFTRNQLNICSLIKKESIDRFGGYSESIAGYEDWNLWIHFAKNGMKFKRIPEVMFFYRKSFISRGFRSRDKDYLKRKMIMQCHPDIYRLPTKEEESLLKQSYLYISPIFLKGEGEKV